MLASFPDQGALFAYDATQSRLPAEGGVQWHPIQLSEAHALRAIASGELTVQAPGGDLIHLRYRRHVEHPDGNWSWIGAERGANGDSAIITFGEKAVFGSIPHGEHPLQLTTSAGQAWVAEGGAVTKEPHTSGDVVVPDLQMALTNAGVPTHTPTAAAVAAASALGVSEEAANDGTVDLVIGYTTGFAERLGGASQAVTRLTFLVDVFNQALEDSAVDGRIRFVRAVQVDYPDATVNRTALFELTGVQCTTRAGTGELPDGGVACTRVGQPASLLPLIVAREQYRADLVSLVRKFEFPENQSCGIAWLIGSSQRTINLASSAFGYSVVSDSNGTQFPDSGNSCRHETLAHEVGHNLGLQHDRATAQGTDDTNGDGNLLDPEEYGRYPYAFGYSTDTFHTIMSTRRLGQTSYRVFSNPQIAFCGDAPCGEADVADNARALRQSMPVIASFRSLQPQRVHNDVDGDGRSDVLLQRPGNLAYWIMNGKTITRSRSFAVTGDWRVVGTGDMDGNGKLDVLWMNSARQLYLWRGDGTSFTSQFVVQMASGYVVAGTGDVDADGKDDILLYRAGQLVQWSMNGATITRSRTYAVEAGLAAVAVGDFNGDGVVDVVMRNGLGDIHVWLGVAGGDYAKYLAIRVGTNFRVAAAQDIDADGKSDLILFRPGQFVQLLMDGSNISSRAYSLSTSYVPVTTGGFDGVGPGDLILQHTSNNSLYLWLGTASAYSSVALPTPASGYVPVR